MFCPQCGTNVKDGVKFCGGCGWAVPAATAALPAEKHCASCGTVLKDGGKFCPDCGVPVSAPVPPDNVIAPEAKESGKSEPKKSTAVDKAVFHHLGSQVYACYLYRNGVVVGNMTDTNGAFIPDVREWLETRYENLLVETKE
jgi:RNA polymerase subunit RPABC4/transcription elongation factor Spt4